ncbi:MAG TPA: shikimate dehydrogenase [Acetobacteraceae bacterium]|jgi:shikimate dehydrogenase|nr:shikimate dehydrogenase [Acetobacteraceae bacterium]
MVLTPPDGSTRLIPIIGDPIAQVKSPGGITAALHARGLNAYVMPAHVSPADVYRGLAGLSLLRNVDAILATVPHKFAAFRHATTATPRAMLLGAANVLRRNQDGTWHADMLDGVAFVTALRQAGCDPAGKRTLLVGAGGAGAAIALALLETDVSVLQIHDADPTRRDALLDRLRGQGTGRRLTGSDDPSDSDIVINATPAGMRADDPLPVKADWLTPDMAVGDVITVPEITPLLATARRIGCITSTGVAMFTAGRDLIVDFLLGT